MKIRKGFVSNSSSSSFIVAVDKGTNVKCTSNPMTCNLNDYVNHTIKTEKELWEYYQDNCGYNTVEGMKVDDEYSYNEYVKCLGMIKQGKVILFGEFEDQGGDREEYMFCLAGIDKKNNPHLTIIENEGGY
jgi:hypothetical protein